MIHHSADYVSYQEEQYELLGGNFSQQFFDSYSITPTPIMIGMSNYRGYVVRYSIDDEVVDLKYLYVNDLCNMYPQIGNRMPKIDARQCGLYDNLHVKLSIDGLMVIGKDMTSRFLSAHYVHHYRTVFRIEFEQGKLSSWDDISVKAALIRQQIDEINEERQTIEEQTERLKHRELEITELYTHAIDLTRGTKL